MPRPIRTPAPRAARATARRPLAWFASPEEQALIAPWNAGRGVPLADVRRAAEQGNGIALNILGILYFDGDGVRRNVATAARKFRASAERGYAGGQGNIGHAYAVGAGVDQDDAQALYWLQLAAEDGRRTTRARITKADAARTEAAHQTRAAQVAQAATEAVTANRDAAEAWDALATHAAKGAAECRHGAELADRTRRRWAR